MASIQSHYSSANPIFLKNFVSRAFCHVRLNVSWSASMLDVTPCEMCSGRDFTLCRSPVSLKEENRNYCDLSGATVLYEASPKCLSGDLKPYHLLHSCVGCTADVTGDHRQNARTKARHHRSQIDLEPPLKVFRLKDFKFRSKGRQGQIQDGVSYLWISYDGDVSLENKRDSSFSSGGHFTLLKSL